MRDPGLPLPDRRASFAVDLSSDWFEVRGVAAASYSAKMIQLESLGDDAHDRFVRDAVREPLHVAPNAKASVSGGQRRCPFPTAGDCVDPDLRPEALRQPPVTEHSDEVYRSGVT